MRAFRREHLDTLDLRTTGMEFASEQIIRASKVGLVFSEFPIPYRRRAGRSKLSSFADGWRHLRLLLAHSPKWAFVVPGGTLLALGLAISAVVIGDVSLFGRTWEFHALAAGALLTIAGSQVLQIGLFARVFAARYFGEPDPGVARLRVEQGILVGALLTLAGLGVCAFVVGSWVTSGLGSLGYENLSVVGVVLVVLGIQTFFGSLFVSVLELGGVHVRPGSTEPAHVAGVASGVSAEETSSLAVLGGREPSLVLSEVVQRQNYVALWRMFRRYPGPSKNLGRYFFGWGSYPYRCRVRTPRGEVAPTLYSHHDIWTVNEVFCREDYAAGPGSAGGGRHRLEHRHQRALLPDPQRDLPLLPLRAGPGERRAPPRQPRGLRGPLRAERGRRGRPRRARCASASSRPGATAGSAWSSTARSRWTASRSTTCWRGFSNARAGSTC